MRIRTGAVAPVAAVLLLTACGGPASLTPSGEETVAARDRAAWSMTAGLQALAELGAPLRAVEGVRLYDDGAVIGVGSQRADEPVPAPDTALHPPEPYPAEDEATQGTDWQAAWTGQTG